ncbi:predicted protein [Nematostella vectensis]|uniref:PiggyBac transposable element-derived protein domain-containing protein n=1 Tax=Nematostella vectensis TaxID=45351 RepID=A7S6Q8_NEMVE|nr:predicted protein [Nematostella vectensis]|eukprot:XP_001632660.1 predicted protein [Nematostella vectensis]
MAACANIFDNDSDDEDDGQASGESDLSFGEESSDEEELESGDEGECDEWSRELHEVELAPFDRVVGLTNILPAEANATDFLEQLFPPDLIDLIVEETNRNARQKDADPTYWESVNASDIKIYLAIRLLQGIKSVPSERDYWATSPFLGRKKEKFRVNEDLTKGRLDAIKAINVKLDIYKLWTIDVTIQVRLNKDKAKEIIHSLRQLKDLQQLIEKLV